MSGNCTIPSNPDVSGIGVRAAIYAQNLTCFLPVIVHLWDRKISGDELKGIKDQSIGMLAVAFAILFTTIILAKGAGGDQTITSYHAAVVLDLSWMNNTSTWIWFILYVHHRSKHDKDRTEATWGKWRDALLEPVRELLGRTKRAGASTQETSIVACIRRILQGIRRIPGRIRRIPQGIRRITWQRIWRIALRIWWFISEQPVLTLGSIHLSLMAAVGIWLWSDPSKFGQPLPTGCDPTLTVVGVPARFSSKPLRIVSLTMYSIVLIPSLNLIPPFVFFLLLHISYNCSRNRHQAFWKWCGGALRAIRNAIGLTKTPEPSSAVPGARSDIETGRPAQGSSAAVSRDDAQPETSDHSAVSRNVAQPKTPHTAFLIVGLVLLVTINILFIVDIELTLRRNKGDQNGDNAWGFGQVLALLLLIIPLRDAWGALQDIQEKLKGVQQQFAEFLRRECQATPFLEELRRFVEKESKPNGTLPLAGITFGSALQLVAYYGNEEVIESLQQGLKSLGQEEMQDSAGMIPTSNHIYKPDDF
ncbi:hypothetical protein B0H14DRAFT_3521251 [Mycena olivaceomarginata]|nr:hypothetical protein B0H14DRAFT_3521251 [Mycena olivaceomarginata]